MRKLKIFIENVVLYGSQLNDLWQGMVGSALMSFDTITGYAKHIFDIGDETETGDGSLNGAFLNDMKVRTGGSLKIFTDLGVFLTSMTWDTLLSSIPSYPRGFISGGIIYTHSSNVNKNIGITDCKCRDSTHTSNINLGAFYKKIDSIFATGTGNGGIPENLTGAGTVSITNGTNTVTGVGTNFTSIFRVGDMIQIDAGPTWGIVSTISNDTNMTVVNNWGFTHSGSTYALHTTSYNTTLHSFVLFNPTTGITDAGFDHRADGSVLLQDSVVIANGFTKLRRVGSFITDASSNIVGFTAYETAGGGGDFRYNTQILESASSSRNIDYIVGLSLPTGLNLKAHLSMGNREASGNYSGCETYLTEYNGLKYTVLKSHYRGGASNLFTANVDASAEVVMRHGELKILAVSLLT